MIINAPFAIVDIGTSTFKLDIYLDNMMAHSRIFEVGLGDGLAQNNHNLTPQAMERGVVCMVEIKEILKKYDVNLCRAVGTSAMRSADNGADFVQKTFEKTGINIAIISGDTEALLIYEGVAAAKILPPECTLVIDIGGGSVEFLIADCRTLHWRQSIDLGTTRLRRVVPAAAADPISPAHTCALRAHITTELHAVWAACATHNVRHICGAANSFDSLSMMICNTYRPKYFYKNHINFEYSHIEYQQIYHKIIQSTNIERQNMPEIPNARKPVMVHAMILIDTIINKIQAKRLLATKFSLKEGICINFQKKNGLL